jgi:predicted ester cyclase
MGEAFNAHDSKKMASYFSDDAVIFAYGEAMGPGHGKDDAQKQIQMVFDTFSDAKSASTRVWIKGNVVVMELVWSGTMTGDMMGIKASKKPAGQNRAHVLWFNDDGFVKELHEYADGAGLLAQMQGKKGAPPVPALPTSPPEVHVAKGTPDEDKLADWAKGTDDAFNKDDPKAAFAGMADDGDYWLNFGGPAMKGKKELTAGLEGWFKAFPDQKWTVTNAWGVDGFGILEHTVSGTQKGRMGPLPPSGKQVKDWHYLDILQPTADGKIAHGWGYANLVEMMAQTGALPKPPAEKAPGAPSGKAPAAKAAPPAGTAPAPAPATAPKKTP